MFHIMRDLSVHKVWANVFFEKTPPKVENFSTGLLIGKVTSKWVQKKPFLALEGPSDFVFLIFEPCVKVL